MFMKKVMLRTSVVSAVAASAFGVVHYTTCENKTETTKATEHSEILARFRPNLEDYEIIDWDHERHSKFTANHALHETLYGKAKVEAYEVYKHKKNSELYCILKFGSSLNGYPGILHGGISALVIDNSYGLLFMALGFAPAFTANLNLNYRSPIKANAFCILKAKVDKQDGRKLMLSATLEDALSGKLCVESTTLFVTMKQWDQWMIKLSQYFF